MAKSELRTKVAILRSKIGISAKQFAELTGRTFYTWKALEAGRLRLSEGLAARISRETGVALEWLLDDAQTGPPIDQSGEPLTREKFQQHVAEAVFHDIKPREASLVVAGLPGQLESILLECEESARFPLLVWKVMRFFEELKREFLPDVWEARRFKNELAQGSSKIRSAGSAQKRTKSVQGEVPSNINPEAVADALRRIEAGSSKPSRASNLSIGDFVGESQERVEEAPKKEPKKSAVSSKKRP